MKLTERADKAWESAGLTRITLHECRHTFASLMIAAGVNAKSPGLERDEDATREAGAVLAGAPTGAWVPEVGSIRL